MQLAGVVGFPPHSLFVFIRTAPSLVGLQQHPKRAGPSEHHVGWCLNTKQVTWPSPEERWMVVSMSGGCGALGEGASPPRALVIIPTHILPVSSREPP